MNTIWSQSMFQEPRHEPVVVGKVVDKHTFMEKPVHDCLEYVLIKLPYTQYRIPNELMQFYEVISKVVDFWHSINVDANEYSCYITADCRKILPHGIQRENFRRIHVDGFQHKNQRNFPAKIAYNFSVFNDIPTRYFIESMDCSDLDDVQHDFCRFFEYNKKTDGMQCQKPWEIAMWDSYTLHCAEENGSEHPILRHFVQLYFTPRIHAVNPTCRMEARNPMFDNIHERFSEAGCYLLQPHRFAAQMGGGYYAPEPIASAVLEYRDGQKLLVKYHETNGSLRDSLADSELEEVLSLEIPFFSGNQLPSWMLGLSTLQSLSLSFSNSAVIGYLTKFGKLSLVELKNQNTMKLLPDCICDISSLTTLKLHDCDSLVLLPSAMGRLSLLKCLAIRSIEGFQSVLRIPSLLNQLEEIGFSDSDVTMIPGSIEDLKNLTSLDIKGCSNLKSFPETLSNLCKLSMLHLLGEHMALENLNIKHQIECLKLSFSVVSLKPVSFEEYTDLRALGLNKISCTKLLPLSLSKLSKLQTLNLGPSESLDCFQSLSCVAFQLKEVTCTACSACPQNLSLLKNLEILSLKDCTGLAELPADVAGLINLTRLDLCRCLKLQSIPDSIGELVKLQMVNFEGSSSLKNLPESLGKLQNLTHLNINGCHQILNIPASIRELKKLTCVTFDFIHCRALLTLPDSIQNLVNLDHLDLIRCSHLQSLPETIGNLSNLTSINLMGCKRLKTLPDSMGNLEKMQSLCLDYCFELEEIPPTMLKLSNLTDIKFDLSNGNISSISNSLSNLLKLSSLELRNCKNIQCLPELIGNLSSLTSVDLEGCVALNELPSSMGNLESLKRMNVKGCQMLRFIPDSFTSLENLTEVVLCFADFMHLDSVLSTVNNLKYLDFLDLEGCCELQALPESICNLENLKSISLRKCYKIQALPDAFGRLYDLNSLNLDGCFKLCNIPKSLISLEKLSSVTFNLSNSPISDPVKCVPESIQYLVNLESLEFAGSDIISLPESVGNLRKLKSIILERCSNLTSLPGSLSNLQFLTELNLNGCALLEHIPQSLCSLEKLDKVDFVIERSFSLNTVPDSIKNLYKLVSIEFFDCVNLISLPESIGQLVHATNLVLSGCVNLKLVPDSIVNLHLLESFDLRKCESLESLPGSLQKLTNLARMALDECSSLNTIPLTELVDMVALEYVGLRDCHRIWSPPHEIRKQGGYVTLNFIRDVKFRGELNYHMTLFLIGDGESGKTSLVNAMKSQFHKSSRIHEDCRTVGIQLSTWRPDSENLEFKILDMAGQEVYGKTHQLFLQRRALYLLVWRAHQSLVTNDQSLKGRILHWMHVLQNCQPGAYMMLAVTHIDTVRPDVLTLLRSKVKDLVAGYLKSLLAIKGKDTGFPIINVLDGGESCEVDCLNGKGIKEFRGKLLAFSKQMPWYGEGLPGSFVKLRDRIFDKVDKESLSFLNWIDYERLVKECDPTIDSSGIKAVTTFFHEIGILRYFGNLEASTRSAEILDNTVYISTGYMIDILKGLIRHDRDAMLSFFMQNNDNVNVRRVNRLITFGRLHKNLIPFLWPCLSGPSKDYWISLKDTEEGKIWTHYLGNSDSEVAAAMNTLESKGYKISYQHEIDQMRAVALLQGFDLMVQQGEEYVVPGVMLSSAKQLRSDVFAECPFQVQYHYELGLPLGAFDGIIVRLARETSDLMYSANSSVFYKLGHFGQVFCLEEGKRLILKSSSKSLLEDTMNQVKRMESFFPGLVRSDMQEQSSGTEIIQVLVLADDEKYGIAILQTIRRLKYVSEVHKFSSALQLPSGIFDLDPQSSSDLGTLELKIPLGYEDVDARVVVVCMTSTIASSKKSCSQLQSHIDAGRAIVPILMHGYIVKDFKSWWPPEVSAMEKYQLFVDMRKLDLTEIKVQNELLPQITKFLEEWRVRRWNAGPTDVSKLSKKGSALPSETIDCFSCLKLGLNGGEVGKFSRKQCVEKLNKFIQNKNKGVHEHGMVDVMRCPKCNYEHGCNDLLTRETLPTVVPCPNCVYNSQESTGIPTVGYFFVDQVRLHLNEDYTSRSNSVECEVCKHFSRLVDIVPPEVFGSYNWGATIHGKGANGRDLYTTQEMVKPLLTEIERQADILCWMDIRGGMGAGENNKEMMEKGVSESKVVLVFLSDAYVLSENCQIEWVFATSLNKFIVPILVPNVDQGLEWRPGVSAGWSGPDEKNPDWWRHAERLFENQKNSDYCSKDIELRKKISWAYLGLYSPLKLPHRQNCTSDTEFDKNYKQFLSDVMRQIMSRLNRSDKLNTNTIQAQKRLVSLKLWKDLADLCVKENFPCQNTSHELLGATDSLKLTREQEEEIREVFNFYDIDGDDSIDFMEFKAAMGAVGVKATDHELKEMISTATGGSTRIKYHNFATMVRKKFVSNECCANQLAASYPLFLNHNESDISFKSLQLIAEKYSVQLGKRLSDAEISGMLETATVDSGSTGEITVSKQSFLQIMKKATLMENSFMMDVGDHPNQQTLSKIQKSDPVDTTSSSYVPAANFEPSEYQAHLSAQVIQLQNQIASERANVWQERTKAIEDRVSAKLEIFEERAKAAHEKAILEARLEMRDERLKAALESRDNLANLTILTRSLERSLESGNQAAKLEGRRLATHDFGNRFGSATTVSYDLVTPNQSVGRTRIKLRYLKPLP